MAQQPREVPRSAVLERMRRFLAAQDPEEYPPEVQMRIVDLDEVRTAPPDPDMDLQINILGGLFELGEEAPGRSESPDCSRSDGAHTQAPLERGPHRLPLRGRVHLC